MLETMSSEPTKKIVFDELISCLNSALDHLDFFELAALRFYVIDGLKLPEIAQRLNIPPSRARRLLMECFGKLREHIGKQFSDEDISSILGPM